MTGQTNFLQALGWAVLNSLWQMALLWIIYQVLTSLFKAAKPSAKTALAGSLLMIGFAWFVYTFFLVFTTNDPVTIVTGGMLHTEADVASRFNSIVPLASVVYLVLLIIPVLRFTRNYRYVQVIRKYGLSRIDAEWRLFVNTIAERMGIRRPVQVWLSEFVSSPVTVGWLKPVILVPMAAVANLSTHQMEAVLLHELSHIRRYDYIINLVISFIRTVLYFNPFAKAFVKIVETEREKSCDEMVLQFQYNSYEYASALLTLEKLSREQRLLMLAAAGSGKGLMTRIESIMGVQTRKGFSITRLGTILGSVLLVMLFNYFLSGNQKTADAEKIFSNAISASLGNNQPDAGQPVAFIEERPLQYTKQVENNPSVNVYNNMAAGGVKLSTALPRIPQIVNVRYEPADPVAILDESQEAMIKEAVESSKKVIEKTQWKSIEDKLADVFSEEEKNELKMVFEKEISRFDWNKWENKLRLAYNNINWDHVNLQLNDALAKLRTDSLMRVYNDAMVNLSHAQRDLKVQSLKCSTDSDMAVSMKALAEKQKQLRKELQQLKSSRNKKIVHL